MSIKAPALFAALLFTAAAPLPALAQTKPAAAAAQPKLTPSKESVPTLAALQKAVNEGKNAEVPALLAAALTAAKTNVDRYFAHQLSIKPSLALKNDAMTLTALEGMIASGIPQGSDLGNLAFNAAKLQYNKGSADTAATARAATLIEQAIALDPGNGDHHVILGEVRNRQKRFPEAVAALQKSISLNEAAGKPIDQRVADRALAFAWNNKLPAARELSFAQLKRAPSPKTWRTALKIYESTSGLNAADKVDLWRLQRLTKSLEGEGDYFVYVDALMSRGLPGEAKAVLDEGFAANVLSPTNSDWKAIAASANTRIAADRASLTSGEKTALAAATARPALNTGDAFLSYGDYAKAAALYRAALRKTGVDADLANLRLGIALTRVGDKAGAATAFTAVKGQRAGIAQMWLVYLQTPTA